MAFSNFCVFWASPDTGASTEANIALSNRGEYLVALGRPADALDPLHRALADFEAQLGADHQFLGFPLTALGRALLALGRPACIWRQAAIEGLERMGRPYRVLYSSGNAGAVAAAVLAGLAVSVFPESGLRPGMRVLGTSDGFPELPSCRVGLVRNPHQQSALAEALSEHIISSLDNLSAAADAAE